MVTFVAGCCDLVSLHMTFDSITVVVIIDRPLFLLQPHGSMGAMFPAVQSLAQACVWRNAGSLRHCVQCTTGLLAARFWG